MILQALFSTARSISGDDAVSIFIKNVLTESEQILIGRRLLIAQMILSGKKQAEIMYELNVSPNTFSRTRKWLNGQIPEYDKALKEFQAEQKSIANDSIASKPKRTKVDPHSFEALKRKYPAHFLLFSLFDELRG